MKNNRLRACLFLLVTGPGCLSWGALKPEGDRIEFSPPRDELRVAPITGSELDRRSFNFQRRDSGGSLTDIPAAVPLPAPDRVNRLRALEELIEKRNAWVTQDGGGKELDIEIMPAGAATEFSIDDLYQRRSAAGDRGRSPMNDNDTASADRKRDDGLGGASRDSLRGDLNDPRSPGIENRGGRGLEFDRDRLGVTRQDSLGRDFESVDSIDGRDRDELSAFGRGLNDTSDRLGMDRSGRLFEFGSLVPESGGFVRDPSRGVTTRDDRMDSLRRVLGGSASTILGPAAGRTGGADPLSGSGVLGTMGAVPGANRSLSQGLDSLPGGSVNLPTPELTPAAERLTSAPNRPFSLDMNSGREGFGSRSERQTLAPPSIAPMEMFRRKHDSRIPTRAF